MPSSTIQRRLLISGRVQGVGFRASTVRAASAYPALRGFVRNLPDGRVEAVFAGSESEVLEMVRWCHQGPPSARVSQVEIFEEPVSPDLGVFGVN